jgi:hypothetical protein
MLSLGKPIRESKGSNLSYPSSRSRLREIRKIEALKATTRLGNFRMLSKANRNCRLSLRK